MKIKKIIAREILDSRAHPTVQAIVELEDGTTGSFSVPSGASIGKSEAHELRDNDPNRFAGLGVLGSLKNIANILAPRLIGMDVLSQDAVDGVMIETDNTQNKQNMGANTILALSAACAKAAAKSQNMPLYKYIGGLLGTADYFIPTPMFNIINGGVHGGDNLDFQEFMVVPPQKNPYSQDLRFGVEIYYALKETLKKHSLTTLVGDEGGYAPQLYSNVDAFKIFEEAVASTRYKFGLDVFISVDVAANHLKKGSSYKLKDRAVGLPASDLMEFYVALNEQFHILSIEDPFAEDDWSDWTEITTKMGAQTLIVGDDLITTNLERLKKAVVEKAANAVIIKPNQVGTITETLSVVKEAKASGFKVIVSHRSGETNDDFIADFAVGVAADYAKFGAPARGERVAKYNRLLEIEYELS